MFDTNFIWSDGATDLSVMDLRNIATHEIGHAFGLLNMYMSKSTELIMHVYSEEGEAKKRDLESGDIAVVQKLYGNQILP